MDSRLYGSSSMNSTNLQNQSYNFDFICRCCNKIKRIEVVHIVLPFKLNQRTWNISCNNSFFGPYGKCSGPFAPKKGKLEALNITIYYIINNRNYEFTAKYLCNRSNRYLITTKGHFKAIVCIYKYQSKL